MRPLSLSDGTVIPANAFLSMATYSISRDPENYADPERFDGFRFYKRRTGHDNKDQWPENANANVSSTRHQFVSTGPDNLAFGHGKFACPGRFFASAQIKVVLASILLNYDLSFPEGQTARPRNVFSGESIGPDRSQLIVFRPLG